MPEKKDTSATLPVKRRPERVVSLLGASTETIYRLGLGHVLVGRSHECDYPPACLQLPCVSRPRFDPDIQTSAKIDQAVRDYAAANEAVYKLQDETLQGLKADLLIAQDHCRVCAVTAKELNNTNSSIATATYCQQIPQLILKPANLADCLDHVKHIAVALGYPERGLALYDTLQEKMNRVEALANIQTSNTTRPRVALLEWCDPIMGCGYWLPELVAKAGGTCLFASPPGGATPTITMASLMEAKPDVLVLVLCGFSISRTVQEIRQAWTETQRERLQQSCGTVFVADGNYLFNRSGPRVVESAEVLLEALHVPFRGHFGHLGTSFLMTLDEAMALEEGIETGAIKNRPPVQEEETLAKTGISTVQPPTESASVMVARQLACLRARDMTQAFAYNSAANQKRWCDAARFAHVINSHDDFQRLLEETPDLQEAATPSNGLVQARLCSNGNEPVTFMWTCVIEQGDDGTSEWRTEKVGIQ